MANIFYRKASANVGTAPVTVGSYTVGSGVKTVVLGLTVSNITGSSISADVFISNGSNNFYQVKDAPITAGGSLVPIGGDQKLVLEFNDNVKVQTDSANSASVIMSIMEIT